MNNPGSSANLLVLAVVALAASIAACTTVEKQSFRVTEGAAVESAMIAANADFSKYSQLLAEDMGIFFPQNSPSTESDMQRIRQIFRDAFLAELESYKIVEKAGPNTMAVQASLIDLRNSTGAPMPGLSREIRSLAKPGSIVFLMEMKDSQSGAVLARAADSAAAPTIAAYSGVQTDWQSVQQAAERWAKLFRQFLDANLAR